MLGPNAWAQRYEIFSLILNEDYYASIHIALGDGVNGEGWGNWMEREDRSFLYHHQHRG